MLAGLRRQYTQLVTSGAQLLLLFVGMQFHSRTVWLYCLVAMALLSLFAWLSALNRLRTIRDTPTSRVASAAQGYVELIGRGQQFCDPPLTSKLRVLPCLWYRYKVEERNAKNDWKTVDSGESSYSFMLCDDTGECVIDPEQAEIITQHQDQWQRDGCRYTEWKLLQHDQLYVIGHFRTQGGSNLQFDTRAELNVLLAEWKKDMPALRQRFDLNKDGELDMNEWLLARQAAKREVGKQLREVQSQSDTHIVSRPVDGRLFLISNLPPEKLFRRYLLWTWVHLVVFFCALGGTAWLWQRGF
jgi:hypothetical protein